jgi:hypothetical protein
MDTTKVYTVPVCNMGPLQKRIDKANKRADLLGIPHITLNQVGETTIQRKNALGVTYDQRCVQITVSGTVPQLEGWELIASLRPVNSQDPKSEVIVQEVPGKRCPAEYRTADVRWCDHCERRTRRTVVYILHDTNLGSYAQVGKTCVGEFLGTTSPESILNHAELIFDIDNLCKQAETSREIANNKKEQAIVGPDIDEFVGVVAVLIRLLGWVPKSKADEDHVPTARIAYGLCENPTDAYWTQFIQSKASTGLAEAVQPADCQLAKDALAWARNLPKTVDTTYLYNLGACCRQPFVEYKNAGYVASVIQAYQNHQERQRQQNAPVPETKQSKHVGTVGERQVFKQLIVTQVREIPTEAFGTKHLVKFVDPDGNILEWWASDGVDVSWAKKGSAHDIRATVKRHGDYKGELTTTIDRAAIEEEGAKPPKHTKKKKEPKPEAAPAGTGEVPF